MIWYSLNSKASLSMKLVSLEDPGGSQGFSEAVLQGNLSIFKESEHGQEQQRHHHVLAGPHKDEMSELFGVVSIGLFGSYARGEAREDSDIDIAIELRPDKNKILEQLLWYQALSRSRVRQDGGSGDRGHLETSGAGDGRQGNHSCLSVRIFSTVRTFSSPVLPSCHMFRASPLMFLCRTAGLEGWGLSMSPKLYAWKSGAVHQ